MIQAGDIVNHDGTGGESIYGEFFEDEIIFHKHDKPYKLAMANLGQKDTNSSQFYITLKACGFLDSTHVVFGHVHSG
jgi:cyclophilin family peptidyl-prolyl cis-trans isomerase